MIDKHLLAERATGNNTHSGVFLAAEYDTVAFQLVIDAVGATPTITWKIQGSLNNDDWYDLAYITDMDDTAATAARTHGSPSAGQAFIQWLSNPVARRYGYFRAVISANTNVTYTVEAYRIRS